MDINQTNATAPWLDPVMDFSYSNVKAFNPGALPKRHTACDECRQRKLKCSGEATGCSRCVKQSLVCHYSLQKPMGRPPKRKRSDESKNSIPSQTLDDSNITDLLPILEGIPDPVGALEAANMCPAIYKSFMTNQYDLRAGPFVTDGPIFESEVFQPEPLLEWKPHNPDYSQINTPMMFQTPNYQPTDSSFSPLAPSLTTQCSCLSYLYLCLSSISTLSSFPLSVHTLTTLYSAARTAKSVIHCQICPQAFNTSMQNLMLLGTLLNVVADGWLLVFGKDAEALGNLSVDPSYIASLPTDPEPRRKHWRAWLHNVVKHAVIGSSVPPIVHAVQSQCLETPSLLSLIEDMEERQRKIHAEGQTWQDKAYPADAPGTVCQHQSEHNKEQDYFCLRVIGSARKVIARFNFDEGESRL
ncbi:hypothetical protein CISG_03598 [Coccidioides immitis RMSCC 3703]|uniref:Zn(2)-C6 fungal-type domain-containing protein n=2 Tax=Coccidioides immitis TaxID=5501 RepID=A0A0J8QQ31_COCIT|nr:hypothetical protein CIRG_04022 [Coccidioides immitis RMSCC 2394]KMU73463.1 hypothetical protein CISG_03598 [Coccidioides immitis RMSCC 3703]